jgi:hypothetical protein
LKKKIKLKKIGKRNLGILIFSGKKTENFIELEKNSGKGRKF